MSSAENFTQSAKCKTNSLNGFKGFSFRIYCINALREMDTHSGEGTLSELFVSLLKKDLL